jgi:hypothetical protein
MPDIAKIEVSVDWTEPERQKVLDAIRTETTRLVEEEKALRNAEQMDASRIKENETKRRILLELQFFVDFADSVFLETNRSQFEDFIL